MQAEGRGGWAGLCPLLHCVTPHTWGLLANSYSRHQLACQISSEVGNGDAGMGQLPSSKVGGACNGSLLVPWRSALGAPEKAAGHAT